ncbi:hypothetical protein [Actinopolyspora saharensis]|uniref:Zinc-finger n=1 Tax=Actinopolyspora saharensis TaxID=995062 RepID=A0A1H1A5F6_9ACTN|nr:hypothetical protein [Actinopolyspora saharensis]SDQ34935.1 hypothetical protein SAMN04489718_1425 [Actinopolyspora saharensis]
MTGTVVVRYRAGIVGETQRQVHLTTLDDSDPAPTEWRTHCGIGIPAEQAEISELPAGMPCLPCLMRSPELRESAAGDAAGAVDSPARNG